MERRLQDRMTRGSSTHGRRANLAKLPLLLILAMVALFFVLSTARSVDAASKKIRLNDVNHDEDNAASASINSVDPGLVQLQQGANLTVGYSGSIGFVCVACGFNVSATQNVSMPTRPGGFNMYVCSFPSTSVYQFEPNTVVSVWLEDCSTGQSLTTNVWPLYLYDTLPSIASVTPDVLIATGGMNISIEIKNPFPLSLPSFRVYCSLSSSPYSWPTFTTGDPSKIVCETGVSVIGPGNLTLFWFSGLYSTIRSNPYPLTVRSNRILSLTPNTGCVLGGSNITLQLQYPGTSSTIPARCLFAAKNAAGETVETAVTSGLLTDSDGSALCQTVPWVASYPLTATLTLIEPLSQSPITNPMPFTYYDDCALQVYPDTVCSIGNVPVSLIGQGYPDVTTTIAQDIRVYLWPRSHMSYEESFLDWAVATVVNATTVTYLTSAREYHYKKLFIQLTNPYFGNVTSLPLLELKNTNSCLSSVSPSVLSIDGGDLVTITASRYTFGASYCLGQSCYNCVFIDSDANEISQPATVVTPYKATCISPPVYGVGHGTVAVSFLMASSGLLTDPLPVSWTDN